MKEAKKGKREAFDYDLRISVHKDGGVAFSFRHDSWEEITNTGYIYFYIANNKIYFLEADSTGYPVRQTNHRGCVCVRQNHVCDWAKDHVGVYKLIKAENGWFSTVEI